MSHSYPHPYDDESDYYHRKRAQGGDFALPVDRKREHGSFDSDDRTRHYYDENLRAERSRLRQDTESRRSSRYYYDNDPDRVYSNKGTLGRILCGRQ